MTPEQVLAELGIGSVPHPGGTLVEHLLRVGALLRDWGAPAEVVRAGYCHAAYGTAGFEVRALDPAEQRPVLRRLIGDAAEQHVYRYSACDRDVTYPGMGDECPLYRDRFTGATGRLAAADVRALAEITAANEFDVLRQSPRLAEQHGAALTALVERAARHLSAAALAAWRARCR